MVSQQHLVDKGLLYVERRRQLNCAKKIGKKNNLVSKIPIHKVVAFRRS